MSNAVPERGLLTDALVTYLLEHADVLAQGLVVGDGDPPASAGWPGGQAQVAGFTPSVTVRTGPAQPLHRETTASRHASWRCRYSLRTIGAVRKQADDGADEVRAAMVDFRPEPLAGWKVQDVVYESLGGVDKKGSGDSATFEVDDTVDVWLVRSRS